MLPMEIKPLTWQQTIPIRHQVLWPNECPSYCQVEGDDQALHFGVFLHGELSCVASIYLNNQSARLRKFATLPTCQGKGVGSCMLNYLIDRLTELDVNYFWFDARESAMAFYNRFGFKAEGQRFYKNGVAYFKMYRPL